MLSLTESYDHIPMHGAMVSLCMDQLDSNRCVTYRLLLIGD